jgi:hypothetical protein
MFTKIPFMLFLLYYTAGAFFIMLTMLINGIAGGGVEVVVFPNVFSTQFSQSVSYERS